MQDAEMKNPLKPLSIFFIGAGIWYILRLVYISTSGLISPEITIRHKMAVTGLCLIALFIVCYLRKSMLAFWAAGCAYPIMFVCNALIRNKTPNVNDANIFTVICVVIIFYLAHKYKGYKEYIKANSHLPVPEVSKGHIQKSKDKNKSYISRNPLEVLFYAAIITALFAIYGISTKAEHIAGGQELPTNPSAHATTLLLVSIFIVCYLKKNIFAWWTMLVTHPIIWPIHYVSRFFPSSLVIPMLCGYLVIIWYLAIKYRAYRDYIA